MVSGRTHAGDARSAPPLSLTVPLIGCLLLIAGCSGGGGSPASTPPGASPSPGDGTVFPTPPSDGAAFQAELLRDSVTEAEYERAVLTTIQCLVDRGGEYENLEWVEDRDKRELVFWIVDPGHTGISPRAYDECYEEYSRDVEIAWAVQHEPSEEEFQERVEAYLQCMRDAGYTDAFFGPEYAETLDDAGHNTRVACEQSAGLLGESLTPPGT